LYKINETYPEIVPISPFKMSGKGKEIIIIEDIELNVLAKFSCRYAREYAQHFFELSNYTSPHLYNLYYHLFLYNILSPL